MTFRELLDGAEILAQSGNPAISGVEYDSRRVEPGDVFVAMQGETSDGNKFIENAERWQWSPIQLRKSHEKEWLGHKWLMAGGGWLG